MEKLIYSDLLNQTEYLRTLAKRGINTFGWRIVSTNDMCNYIYTKLNKDIVGTYVSSSEQDFIYYSLLNLKSFNDAKNIRKAIDSFRETGNGNTPDSLEPFLNTNFSLKKDTILDAFSKYNEYKANNHLYDQYDLLYGLLDNPTKIGNLAYYKDLPVIDFALDVFAKYFDIEELSYKDALGVENKKTYKKCYGKNNEVEYVLNTINGKLSLDECLIVTVNTEDAIQVALGCENFNLNYTSSIGKPFSHYYVGKFLRLIKDMKNKCFGVDAYKALFAAPFFKKDKFLNTFTGKKQDRDIKNFIKYAGWRRLDFNSDPNEITNQLYESKFVGPLRSLCVELNKGIYEFIKDNCEEDECTFESLERLNKYIEYGKKYNVDIDDVIDTVLAASLEQHISRPGAIHIASIDQAFSTLRSNVFIIGLDSSFPGNPKENYLIYDEEYNTMGAAKYTSEALIKEKEQQLELLIECSPNPYLSYSYFSNTDLKNINPSSVISKNVDPETISEFTYKNDKLNINVSLIDKYNDGYASNPINNHIPVVYDPKALLDKSYSPSQFEGFFTNKLVFVLNSMFGINLDDEDKPHEAISAADRGTLFHDFVVSFVKSKYPNEDDFVKEGLETFDNFFKKKPPMIPASVVREKESYERALRTLYRRDPGRDCYAFEQWVSGNINGINFGGRYDRIEKYLDPVTKKDVYVLVDYKTGSAPQHISDDPVSCIQALLYAALVEMNDKNIKIAWCEFRYPFIDYVATIKFNSDTIKAMNSMIDDFKIAINNADFSCDQDLSQYGFYDKYAKLISLFKEVRR